MKLILLSGLICIAQIAQADLAEMFPEQLDGGTGSRAEQAALATTDGLFAYLLLNRADPKQGDLAKLAAKQKLIDEKIKFLQKEAYELEPTKQIQTLEASIATRKEQQNLASAEAEFHHAEQTMVKSVRDAAIEQESNKLVLAAQLETYDYGAAKRLEDLQKRPVVGTQEERNTRLNWAQERLSQDEIDLEYALNSRHTTRPELARFPATDKTISALEARLAILQHENGRLNTLDIVNKLQRQIKTEQTRQVQLLAKADRLAKSSQVLKRAVMYRGLPQVLAALTLSDLGIRAYVYYKGRDPGYAPVGTFLDTVRNLGDL